MRGLDQTQKEKLRELLQDRTVVVLGLGVEGLSTLKFLLAHSENNLMVADAKDAAAELRHDPAIASRVAFHCGGDYLSILESHEVIVMKSPGIPATLPALEDFARGGGRILSNMTVFFELFAGTSIAISGTKGKSTTSSFVHRVLTEGGKSALLCGNMGEPALDRLTTDAAAYAVCELSSYQLHDLRRSPHVAVLTNLYPEHLDWHGSFEAYRDAKANLLRFQKAGDVFVCSDDVPGSDYYARLTHGDVLKVSTRGRSGQEIAWIENGEFYLEGRKLCATEAFHLSGEFNQRNALCALAVGAYLQIPDDALCRAVEKLSPLPYRLEEIGVRRGIRFVSDSLATVPAPTMAALDAFGGKVGTLIAGGVDRGVDYTELGAKIIESKVKAVILFPTTGEAIEKAISAAQPDAQASPRIVHVGSMREAVQCAYELTQSGEICLLSPASSSRNLFRDYKDRGDQFRELVLELGG